MTYNGPHRVRGIVDSFTSVVASVVVSGLGDSSPRTITGVVEVVTTTRLPLPVAGELPLSAQILSEVEGATTYAISDCTTSANSCVLFEPLTVTAGPSTYHVDDQGYWGVLGKINCTLNNHITQTAICDWTIGEYPSLEMENLATSWITTPAATSTSVQTTITDMAGNSQAFLNIALPTPVTVTRYDVPNVGPTVGPNAMWMFPMVALSVLLARFSR